MKDKITQQFDESDIERVNILTGIGYTPCCAKVIVALASGNMTQQELTVCTGENQSAISIALKMLEKAVLVGVSKKDHVKSKGRPKNVYNLVSWKGIVDAVEQHVAKETTTKNEEINRLKELTN